MNNNLETLVQTLEHQNEVKKDYISAPANMFFVDGKLFLSRDTTEIQYHPSTIFHSQLSEYLKIPKQYYDRMFSEPKDANQSGLKLFDQNVNYWLAKTEKPRLIRTFEDNDTNTARAFLSENYNMIDNFEVLMEALEAIRETGLNIEIKECDLSDSRMYINVICPDVEVEAKDLLHRYAKTFSVGTGIVSGLKIQNSEVGKGTFLVMPRAVITACNNGAIHVMDALRKIHLGAKIDDLGMDKVKEIRAANLKLIKEQLKYAVKTFLSKQYLENLVSYYTNLGKEEIKAPIAGVVEVVAQQYGITEARKNNILNYFIKGADTRRIGIANAITEELQTLSDADQRHDGEVMALEVLQDFDNIEAAAFKTKFSGN